jgi:acyl carrier protein
MASIENNADTLRSLLARTIDPKLLPSELRNDLELQKDLDVDSAMLVDIVLDLEEHYSINVADEELNRVRTVGDLSRLISAAGT